MKRLDAMGGPVLVGSVALVLGAVFVLIWLNRPGASVGTGDFKVVDRATVEGRTWGNPAAPVRIIAFEDFQCPFCQRYTQDIEPQLGAEFVASGTVVYEFRHMAFLGEESIRAAQASECALEQGQFWPYHDILYLRQGRENSGVYTVDHLKAFGREVDGALPPSAWDQAAFEGCLDSGRTRATVEAMTRESSEAGVRSTPSLMINGRLLTGVQSIEQVRRAIAEAMPGGG